LTTLSWRAGAQLALALVYPILIYCALVWFEPRVVAAALVALILLRRRQRALALIQGMSWISHAIVAALVALCLAALFANDETLLRLYPAGVSVALLIVFGLSLCYPPSTVERIARLSNPELPAAGLRYTRQVTGVWCAFFAVNASIAVWTAVAASREAWALYNGFIAYIAMGVLFAGEWLLRRRLFPESH